MVGWPVVRDFLSVRVHACIDAEFNTTNAWTLATSNTAQKQSPPRPPNSVGKAGRVAAFGWFFLVGIASTLSLGSVLPMPTMSLWLLKVGVLSGVLHATLLKTYVSMAVLSLTGYFYTKGTKVNEKYMLACGFALAAIVVHSTPMVANLALASRVPGESL